MARYKGMFERYLEAAERTGDIMLRYYFQKETMREQLLSPRKREQLVQETADLVLSRLTLTVDAQEVFDAIDGLTRR